MPLEEKQRQLDKREIIGYGHTESEYDPDAASKDGSETFRRSEEWKPAQHGFTDKQKKIFKMSGIVAGVLLLLLSSIYAFIFIQGSFYNPNRVSVSIDGPEVVAGGSPVEYSLVVKNNNRKTLVNAELILEYSEDFVVDGTKTSNYIATSVTSGRVDLGTMGSHEEREVTVHGVFYGPVGHLVFLRPKFRYAVEGTSLVVQTDSQLGVRLESAPLEVAITAPFEVAPGDTVNYVVNYTNQSFQIFDSVYVRATYPDDFVFVSSQPSPAQGENFWNVGRLTQGQTGRLELEGIVRGSTQAAKEIRFDVGVLESDGRFSAIGGESWVSRVVKAPFMITQTVNNLGEHAVDPNEKLEFELTYQNTGKIGLRDAIVTLDIDAQALDFSRFELYQKGNYDNIKKQITWKATDYPDLAFVAPGASGTIKFFVYVLEDVPVTTVADKNYIVTSTAKIDSPSIDTPVGSNKIVATDVLRMKVNSNITISAQGFYTDKEMVNTGPIPPQIGQETTYTMRLFATNSSNQIADARVTVDIPTHMEWVDEVLPDDATIEYNERTNQIIWNLGQIENGVGIISPAKEVAFKVRIRPTADMEREVVTLLKEQLFEARDLFTGEDLNARGSNKTTNLPEDPTIKHESHVVGGKVQKNL